MQWLSVWLQETNFPYPGPKCQDGRLLRSSRIDKNLCNNLADNQQRHHGVAFSDAVTGAGLNHLPLLNEHGDIFQRELQDYNDECEVYELPPAERPLPGESEYFYDQYVDYPPAINETVSHQTTPHDSPALGSHISTSNTILQTNKNTILQTNKKPSSANSSPISSGVDLNNTILNTNYFKKKPIVHSSSPFTFFGYPIPSISLGRFFGANERGRKDRGEHGAHADSMPRNPSSTTTEMPATHRMFTGSHGKVRMYQPNSAEFEKYLKNKDDSEDGAQYVDVNGRKRFTENSSDETSSSSENPSSVFKTGFRVPSSVERGGFKPIMPEHSVGGFMPVHDPTKRRGTVEVVASSTSKLDKTNRLNRINLQSEGNFKNKIPSPHPHPTTTSSTTTSTTTESAMSEEIESHTYYVTENGMEEETTTYRPMSTLRRFQPAITSTNTTTTTPTTSTTTVTPPTTSMPTGSDIFDSEFYDDLEAQSVTMMKPPPFVQTTTSETILLIPPPEELVEQIKRQSWMHTTPKSRDSQETNDYLTTVTTSTTTTTSSTTPVPFSSSTGHPLPYLPRPGGAARSTVTKVFTPQASLQHHHHHHNQPTAEEYQRTTPSLTNKPTEEPQLTANAQKRDEPSSIDRIDRKDGMDWYYESFKKSRAAVGGSTKPISTGSSSLRSSGDRKQNVLASNAFLMVFVVILQNYLLF